MARVKLPCMSMEAHGKVGGVLVFATNRWGQYVKIMTPPRYPNTEAQKKVKHAYGQVGQYWRTLTPEQKETFHSEYRLTLPNFKRRVGLFQDLG
ncbi:unnamed protein product [marine sediment metagenome]|uniref:Uncharacterized protein n=1 Tax=marine sediment metagenome TaxID=412755 RepID=X1GGC8_9ZZZZ